jgi:hypothetical protein
VLYDMDQVTPKPTTWLWKPRIPFGELTLVEGNPGVNKGGFLIDMVARLSMGAPMPCGSKGKPVMGASLCLVGEDSVEKTVLQRLEAAGADTGKVKVFTAGVYLPDDLGRIADLAEKTQAKLITIDPLPDFMKGSINSSQAVRQALTPLAKFAHRTNTAVLITRHLNKTGGKSAVARGSGSHAILAVMRSAFLIGKCPDNDDLRVLAHHKANLGPEAPSLLFEPVGVRHYTGALTYRIEWRGLTEYSDVDLLSSKTANKLAEAKELLRVMLANGPVEQKTLKAKADTMKIGLRTLERAKEILNVQARRRGKVGPGSSWWWSLPG